MFSSENCNVLLPLECYNGTDHVH